MNLKDCKIKGYSLDVFKVFAKLVGERLGIATSKDYKKYVERSCKNIKKALSDFYESIPRDEKNRYILQSSIHDENGNYKSVVYDKESLIVNLKKFFKVYEDAALGLVVPPKISRLRSVFRKIFSSSNKQPTLTPSERDHIFASLLELKRTAYKFIDEICAHDEFEHFCVHMPGRSAGDNSEWKKGEMVVGNDTYVLPINDDRFKGAQSNRNAFIDKKNKCYYFRDDSKRLYKIGASGKILEVINQGSFGEPLDEVINRYEKFFDF